MKYFLSVILFPLIILAQNSDSLLTKTVADSTIAPDSTKKKYDVDAVVFANATDSVTFDVKNKNMILFGKGDVTYKNTNLKSARIFVDFDRNLLDAVGAIDSSDSNNIKLVDTPVLKEGEENYEGTSLKYNFKNQSGFISMAKNSKEDKRYEGEKVKKVDKKTYFIEDGLYTTCDEDTPHTYFTASKMKVMQDDKIIARWIFMNVGGVPFPIPLPFGVFPNKSGRRSGIIAPSYGSAGNRGYYFRNGGYFFALSDYFDLTTTGDYYLQGGYGLRSRFRYIKRYDFNGNINGGISKITAGEKSDPDYSERFNWNLNVYHHQEIDPTMTLDANLQFLSNKYLTYNSVNINDLLQQDIISNATLVKRWDESGNSISINYSRSQNLESGNISEVLPSINFNKSISFPFKSKTATGRDQKWFELIGYSYSSRFQNNRTKYWNEFENSFKREINGGFEHNINISASPKIGYFNIAPSISYNELWYNKRIKKGFVAADDSSENKVFQEKIIKQISFVRTFDFRLSASTKIYGMLQPNILGIQAFRHTLMPAVSYNYRPDFSNEKWGYYDSYIDTSGRKVNYDKYEKGIFGGAGSGEQQRLGFSIGNLFEIKTTKNPNDTTSQEQKIQLLNINASAGYNFAADSLKLSNLNVDFRTSIGQFLSLNGNSTFTFYDYQSNKDGSFYYPIDRFLASEGKGLMRLINFGFNVSTNLSGDKLTGKEKKKTNEENQNDGSFKKRSDYIELFDDEMPDLSIPWNLSVNYNYSVNKINPVRAIENSGLGVSLSLSLTQAWRLTFRGNYDFREKKMNAPQVTIYRDLHCWEMNFVWNPIGTYRGFRFEIRMKAPELQDIKITKTKDIYSGF